MSTQTNYNQSYLKSYFMIVPGYLKLLVQIHQNETMLKHFWSIDFCRLKVRNLSGHRLVSLEGITFMNIPNLQCLELHNNNLQSIDCLSKISTPKLRILTLYSNKIQRCDKLTRLNSNKLREWEFDTENMFSAYRVQILDFMFKMRSLSMLEKIYIQDEMRICNKKKIDLMNRSRTLCRLPLAYKLSLKEIHRMRRMMFD